MKQLVLAAALGLLAVGAEAQDVGDPIGDVILEELTQTKAGSYQEFTGRAVLLEFFAYW